MIEGIDVSQWQGHIDWNRVKVDFAIVKAGFGRVSTQIDPYFERNYAGAKAAGIPVGAYWYSYAKSETEAVQEAFCFLSAVKGKVFEFPLYFDIEEPETLVLGKAKCSAIAKAFLETVEKAGYYVGIYSSKCQLEKYISADVRKRYCVWVAHYGVSKTDYSGAYGMWQYSDCGRVSGISGNVDVNNCYIDYPARIKAKKLNGFSRKSNATIAAEVLCGTWGNGEERKQKLTDAGYDYNTIQALVNKLVK